MMKIRFVQKEFALDKAYQKLQEKDKYQFDPELIKRYGGILYDVESNDNFKRQYQESPHKELIKKYIKDLKRGYLYIDGKVNSKTINTHFLSEFSRAGRGHLTFSKNITEADRFIYRIYPPEVTKTKEGKFVYRIQIVIINCEGHYIPGIGTYSKPRDSFSRVFKDQSNKLLIIGNKPYNYFHVSWEKYGWKSSVYLIEAFIVSPTKEINDFILGYYKKLGGRIEKKQENFGGIIEKINPKTYKPSNPKNVLEDFIPKGLNYSLITLKMSNVDFLRTLDELSDLGYKTLQKTNDNNTFIIN